MQNTMPNIQFSTSDPYSLGFIQEVLMILSNRETLFTVKKQGIVITCSWEGEESLVSSKIREAIDSGYDYLRRNSGPRRSAIIPYQLKSGEVNCE